MYSQLKNILFCYGVLVCSISSHAQQVEKVKVISAGLGWANNSINTVVFRKNALCTYKDVQYISYYNNEGAVVLGKRKLSSTKWELITTDFRGNVDDAHNSISIMVDGGGFLHLAWNHHNNLLHYSKSLKPGSLQMSGELPMTGFHETAVTYPEFYSLPDGNLIFFYRDGQSGQGNLVINKYILKEKKWKQLYSNLIDGEQKRNAYWQACVDVKGTIHISWVWRETADVASNHDICYARSSDDGISWENSKGEKYDLPINATTAEYICHIPQKSELINQTSMYADDDGTPFIASYWKDEGDSVPQFHIIYNIGNQWKIQNLGFRKTPFTLSGAGTKRIPVSRPQIIGWRNEAKKCIAVIFRDEERGNRVSVALNADITSNKWKLADITTTSVGLWEPSYDTELWKKRKQLNLFLQFTDQKDAEGKAAIAPQKVSVLSFEINK